MNFYEKALKKVGRKCIEIADKSHLSEQKNISDRCSILFNTVPKSGSVYILEVFRKLGFQRLLISNSTFPVDLLLLDKLKTFEKGNYIDVEHIDPSLVNVYQLSLFLNKVIIHTRDPRQAMLSLVHHILNLKKKNISSIHNSNPPLPEDYFNLDLSNQIDWQIDNHLPQIINWISGWLEVDKNNRKIKLMFTRFEDLKKDSMEFVKSMLNFCEIDIPDQKLRESIVKPQQGVAHYRKGLTNEWTTVFTPDQIRKANEYIPEQIANRFGWVLSG